MRRWSKHLTFYNRATLQFHVILDHYYYCMYLQKLKESKPPKSLETKLVKEVYQGTTVLLVWALH